jgi:hypothetical protein
VSRARIHTHTHTHTHTQTLCQTVQLIFCSGCFLVLFCNGDAKLLVFEPVHIHKLSHIVSVSTQWWHIHYFLTRLSFTWINLTSKWNRSFCVRLSLLLDVADALTTVFCFYVLNLFLKRCSPIHRVASANALPHKSRILVIFKPARRSWLYQRILLWIVACFVLHCHLWNGIS